VNEEERRSKNLMIHGLEENENEDISPVVDEVFKSMSLPAPDTIDGYRVGRRVAGSGKKRPVRLEYYYSGDVDFALAHSSKLKNSTKHSAVYHSLDTT
jgi:hypothetical protein